MYNNTLSSVPTRFLRGVELVQQARKVYDLCSENWTYPVFSFGSEDSDYYAEMWVDGMDWNQYYYLIERIGYEDPTIFPALVFEEHKELDLFNDYDFDRLKKAICDHRRSNVWAKPIYESRYNDDVWNFMKPRMANNLTRISMDAVTYSHASQKPSEFHIHRDCHPNIDKKEIHTVGGNSK